MLRDLIFTIYKERQLRCSVQNYIKKTGGQEKLTLFKGETAEEYFNSGLRFANCAPVDVCRAYADACCNFHFSS